MNNKEIWRLRLNWVLIWLVTPLYSISQVGTASSFHQFMTNPTLEEMENVTHQEIEPGLGQTELFYSLLIAAFEFGAMIGGLVSGFLIGTIPYWYLWNIALVFHVVGYVIYSVAYQDWLIMISRLLAGYFLGAFMTLSFSYFAKSSETYIETHRKLGNETNENSIEKVKNFGFTIISLGNSAGFVIAGSVAVIFAQFHTLNQFRAIGWFNIAYGMAALGLFFVLFRGESRFKKNCLCSKSISCKQKHSTNYIGPLMMFIIVSLILLSFVVRTRFTVFQTLFNPIASDSFGFDERYASYLSLAISVPQVIGSLALLFLQRMSVSNRAIVVFGMLTTTSGYLLLTDFQAIPYDPCTEYSPFHHPNITNYNMSLIDHGPFSNTYHNTSPVDEVTWTHPTRLTTLTSIQFFDQVRFGFTEDESSIELHLGAHNFTCKEVNECVCTRTQNCLHIPMKESHHMQPGTFQCSKFCVFLNADPQDELNFIDTNTKNMELAKIESINVLPDDINIIAKNNCIEANISGHQCCWIPLSIVTQKECEDCQPICRSVSQTLTFVQFSLAFGLMMFSNAFQLTPVIALITDQVPIKFLGITIGIMTSINSFIRTISPLIFDAIYEGMRKRIFALTLSLAVLHILFLVELVLLYPKLRPRKDQADSEPVYSKLKQDEIELKQDEIELKKP